MHSSCMSPSICSTNSSVNNIYTWRMVGSNKCIRTQKLQWRLWLQMCQYLQPGTVGCIRMLFRSKRSFHSCRHKCNGCVSVDTFVSKVSPMEQPTPADDKTQYVMTICTFPFGEEKCLQWKSKNILNRWKRLWCKKCNSCWKGKKT